MSVDDGIDLMNERIERSRRRPPPPRRPQEAIGGEAPPTKTPAPSSTSKPTPPPRSGGKRPARSRTSSAPPRLSPDDASANLAIRVRRPLDDRLADLIYQLRREGIRSSKVEIVEMLLYELPETAGGDLRARLARFRDAAPRGSAAPLD